MFVCFNKKYDLKRNVISRNNTLMIHRPILSEMLSSHIIIDLIAELLMFCHTAVNPLFKSPHSQNNDPPNRIVVTGRYSLRNRCEILDSWEQQHKKKLSSAIGREFTVINYHRHHYRHRRWGGFGVCSAVSTKVKGERNRSEQEQQCGQKIDIRVERLWRRIFFFSDYFKPDLKKNRSLKNF